MTPEEYKRVSDLFLQAIEVDESQRANYLDEACGKDGDLRREVEALLSHDSKQTLIERGSTEESSPSLLKPKRATAWLRLAKLTRYLSPRGQFAFGAFAAVVFIVLLAAFAQRGIASFQRTLRASALQEILDGKIAGLEMWIDHQEEIVASWARCNELREVIRQLVDLADRETSPEQIRTSPLQDQLREVIFRLAGEEVSYQLWSRKYLTLADEPERKAVGSDVTPFGASLLAKVFAGEVHLTTYDRDRRIADTQSTIHAKSHAGTVTPVRDLDGSVIAALLIVNHNSPKQVAKIFGLVDLGISGETYAFNDDGMLLTASRFESQLRDLGLIPAESDSTSVRFVRLHDPGGDLTRGYQPTEPLAARPLTKMAKYATAGLDGVDVHGYRDYRGVMVVGAWRWLDEYGVGVATELDKDEIEHGLRVLVAQAWVIFALFVVCLGVIGHSYYSVYRLRKSAGKHTKLGQYTLEDQVGEGGMGRVFRARHAHLKRPTAIKLLKPELLDRESIARFEREAQLASQLTHPNTIQVFDYGVTDEGLLYYVMEFVDGPSLAMEVERQGAFPPARAIHVLKQVLGSLMEAHDAGLIHRDLKPQNIMLCRRGGVSDVVKVVDFGLVKHLTPRESPTITAPGMLAGTPIYIAPERLRDPNSAAATTDIYSFGAVAFFLITGREVFLGRSVADLLYQVSNVDPPRPSVCGAEIPAELDNLVMECLAKSPDERPQSISEVQERISAISASRTDV